MLYQLNADDCSGNKQINCVQTGAETATRIAARRLQIRILANHTEDLLDVYIRPAEFAIKTAKDGNVIVPLYPPPPLWFQDIGSTKARVTRDVERCSNANDMSSCQRTYMFDFDKGPHRSFFYVGVVGKYSRSQYVPFEFTARVINTGNPMLLARLNISSDELNSF